MTRYLILLFPLLCTAASWSEDQRPFFDACWGGEVNKVTAWLGRDPSIVKARNVDGENPLMWAARGAQVEVVALLLNHGAEPSARGKRGQSALHVVPETMRPHVEIPESQSLAMARFLLEHKAELDGPDADGYTPLYLAAGSGRVKVVEFLLDKGANPGKACRPGTTLYEGATVEVKKFLRGRGISH